MHVTQCYEIVNNATAQLLGESVILSEDLSNIVDVGDALFGTYPMNSIEMSGVSTSMLNQIGRMVFVDRKYSGSAPSVLMDGWEYGSILAKVSSDLPEATENETWELQNGASYDPNIFYGATAELKFFNKRVTFEIDRSFTNDQLKQAFTSGEQMNAFLSMLFNNVQKSMTVKMDSLVMRTINNFTAETLYNSNNSGDYTGAGTTRAVNVLAKYKAIVGDAANALTATNCLKDAGFLRYLYQTIGLTSGRMSKMSELYNIGGKARFTPTDLQHLVLLDEVKSAGDFYLYNGTNQFLIDRMNLPSFETVPFWQGSGTDYGFDSTSAINVVTSEGHSVSASGILAVMFDRDACGVTNLDNRVETNYNPKASFTNYFYKFFAGYFNDFNENFVVFYVA